MKKKLLKFLILIFLLNFQLIKGFSQDTLYYFNFDDSLQLVGWQNISTDPGYVWQWGCVYDTNYQMTCYNDLWYAYLFYYYKNAPASNIAYLISPELKLDSISKDSIYEISFLSNKPINVEILYNNDTTWEKVLFYYDSLTNKTKFYINPADSIKLKFYTDQNYSVLDQLAIVKRHKLLSFIKKQIIPKFVNKNNHYDYILKFINNSQYLLKNDTVSLTLTDKTHNHTYNLRYTNDLAYSQPVIFKINNLFADTACTYYFDIKLELKVDDSVKVFHFLDSVVAVYPMKQGEETLVIHNPMNFYFCDNGGVNKGYYGADNQSLNIKTDFDKGINLYLYYVYTEKYNGISILPPFFYTAYDDLKIIYPEKTFIFHYKKKNFSYSSSSSNINILFLPYKAITETPFGSNYGWLGRVTIYKITKYHKVKFFANFPNVVPKAKVADSIIASGDSVPEGKLITFTSLDSFKIGKQYYALVGWADSAGNFISKKREYKLFPLRQDTIVQAIYYPGYKIKLNKPKALGTPRPSMFWKNKEITSDYIIPDSDTVNLQIWPDETDLFLGWYDSHGNLLSKQLSFNLIVHSDSVVEPKFKVCHIKVSTVPKDLDVSSEISVYDFYFDKYFDDEFDTTIIANTTINLGSYYYKDYSFYSFDKWINGKGDYITSDNEFDFKLTKDTQFIAVYKYIGKKVTIQVYPENSVDSIYAIADDYGGIKYTGRKFYIPANQWHTIYAVPKPGYIFKDWTMNDSVLSTKPSVKIKINKDITLKAVLSLTDPAHNLSIWPNPADEVIHLITFKPYKVFIYNLLGRKMLETAVNKNKTIYVGNLKSGIYLVRFIAENQDFTYKLIISHSK